MGTRSLTIVVPGKGEHRSRTHIGDSWICMYRQFDGYPEGHGQELADFLKDTAIVNGMSLTETRTIFNGMDCLAASIIAKFKYGPGGIYLSSYKNSARGEEYIYIVFKHEEHSEPWIRCFGWGNWEVSELPDKLIFEGPASFFDYKKIKDNGKLIYGENDESSKENVD